MIAALIGCIPIIINGEGYKFNEPFTQNNLVNERQKIKFAYVGRLLKSKGVDRLLKLFSVYCGDRWEITLIGDRDFNNADSIDAEDMLNYSRLKEGQIKFLGFQRDVAAHLRQATVYISLSDREGIPFGVLDAINAGLFIILSSVPGHVEFSGLPGVIIVENDLNTVLNEIIRGAIDVNNFDRLKRLNICKDRFGIDSISVAISSNIFNN